MLTQRDLSSARDVNGRPIGRNFANKWLYNYNRINQDVRQHATLIASMDTLGHRDEIIDRLINHVAPRPTRHFPPRAQRTTPRGAGGRKGRKREVTVDTMDVDNEANSATTVRAARPAAATADTTADAAHPAAVQNATAQAAGSSVVTVNAVTIPAAPAIPPASFNPAAAFIDSLSPEAFAMFVAAIGRTPYHAPPTLSTADAAASLALLSNLPDKKVTTSEVSALAAALTPAATPAHTMAATPDGDQAEDQALPPPESPDSTAVNLTATSDDDSNPSIDSNDAESTSSRDLLQYFEEEFSRDLPAV
ncbi:hypothetical protein DFJ73DRAFT_856826 [Zopfochytrium polystomum]|nr:hypothetical protein DFJ73DRAFT_856826 [Zopfochytrium polystomum]